MPKFEVQIFGKVPDCIEVEAVDAEDAEDKAVSWIMDELDFQVSEKESDEPGNGIRKNTGAADAASKRATKPAS